jgi:hypothetical protein
LPALGKSVRPYLKKYTGAKRDGDMALVVEHLPSNYKSLNTNPSTGKKKKVQYCI